MRGSISNQCVKPNDTSLAGFVDSSQSSSHLSQDQVVISLLKHHPSI